MTDLTNTTDLIKNQGSAVKSDLEEIANAAMELVAKHLQITVKAVVEDLQGKLKKYIIPIIVVIPLFIFSLVNVVYKSLVLAVTAAAGENLSQLGVEIAASVIIFLITLTAGLIYAKKLKSKPE